MKQDPCLLHGLDFEREHVQALQPDNEFAKLIKYVDHLIELRRNTREEQADSFGAAAPSADLIKKQTRLNFEKTKNAISKMKLIAAMSNIKNEKQEFFALFQSDEYLRDVLKNDQAFKIRIEEAIPEARYYLNAILEDIDEKYVQKLKDEPEKVKISKGNAQKVFKENMMLLAGKQLKFNKKSDAQVKMGINLQDVFKPIQHDDGTRKHSKVKVEIKTHKNMNMGELLVSPLFQGQPTRKLTMGGSFKRIVGLGLSEMLKSSVQSQLVKGLERTGSSGGRIGSTKKIRYLIQKHFLTGFPHSKRKPQTRFDFVFIAKMAVLNRYLDHILPERQGIGNISLAYRRLGSNLYKNKYQSRMQDLIQSKIKATITMSVRALGGIAGNQNQSMFSKAKMLIQPAQPAKKEVQKPNQDKLLTHSIQKPLNAASFYAEVKHSAKRYDKHEKLSAKLHQAATQVAMNRFFLSCQEQNIVPKPDFVTFEDNSLYLCERFVSEAQAKVLKNFLMETQNSAKCRVEQLIIDNCQMKDVTFAHILDGLVYRTLSLKSLTYANNQFGEKSLFQVRKLMPCLNTISLNNIQTRVTHNSAIVSGIIELILESGELIQNIKLSNLQINDQQSVQFSKIIKVRQNVLQSINLSWAGLSANSLAILSNEIVQNPNVLKNLNLSYNQLNWLPNSPGEHHSKTFVKNMVQFFSLTEILNHLDLSGMNLKQDDIILLSQSLYPCPNLMGIHLNDCGIITSGDNFLFMEILDIFGLGHKEVDQACRAKHEHSNKHAIHQIIYEDANSISRESSTDSQENTALTDDKMLNIIAEAEKSLIKTQLDTAQSTKEREGTFGRKLYKDFYLLSNDRKLLYKEKIQNAATWQNGIGNNTDGLVDQFVLTRKVNHPELIWNQDPQNDHSSKKRYFEVDAAENWQLSMKNECFVCDGHKYTAIFFKRGVLSSANQDLMEITDKHVLDQLKEQYDAEPTNKDMLTPTICGSVVDGGLSSYPFSRMKFQRKLRMLRLELFGTLCISQSAHFVKTLHQSIALKSGIVKFTDIDQERTLDAIGISQKLVGWSDIVHDKCLMNELTDVQVINAKNFEDFRGEFNKDFYVYANYLAPGRHKFLIYCPQSERAFVKTVVIGLNTKEFYPELPRLISTGNKKKLVQNVWRQWSDDTQESLCMAISKDTSVAGFDMGLFVKEPQQLRELKHLLTEQFQIIQTNYIEIMKHTDKYPYVDWPAAQSYGSVPENFMNEKEILSSSQVELCFIRAARNCPEKKLRGKLMRSEYIDFVARLASSAFPKQPAARAMAWFISIYLAPVHDRSKLLNLRKIIRDRPQLNELLYENRRGLGFIYDHYRAKASGLTKPLADSLVWELLGSAKLKQAIGPDASVQALKPFQITECFLHSLMTIQDEAKDAKKYQFLRYVEFLEFLCRVAIVGIEMQEPVEHKVFALLHALFSTVGILTEQAARNLSPEAAVHLIPLAVPAPESDAACSSDDRR